MRPIRAPTQGVGGKANARVMSINSRRKGANAERALVRILHGRGFAAEKTSRTGYSGHDLTVPVLGLDRRVEVKVQANGFQRLYDWLTGADPLILRADRREPLVVLPLKLAAEIAAVAEGRKTTVEAQNKSHAADGRLPVVSHLPVGDA